MKCFTCKWNKKRQNLQKPTGLSSLLAFVNCVSAGQKENRCSETNRWVRNILGVTSDYEVMQKGTTKKNKCDFGREQGQSDRWVRVGALQVFTCVWKLQRRQKLTSLSSGNFGEMFPSHSGTFSTPDKPASAAPGHGEQGARRREHFVLKEATGEVVARSQHHLLNALCKSWAYTHIYYCFPLLQEAFSYPLYL